MSAGTTPPDKINAEQAEKIAEAVIQSTADEHDFVIVGDQTVERPFGWVFFYTTRKHLKTGDPSHMVPGNGPLLVLRKDGSHEWLTTAMPPQRAIQIFEDEWLRKQ